MYTFWNVPQTSGQLPGPRAAHSCDVIDGRMWVFGGWNGKRALNDLSILHVGSGMWCEIAFGPAGAAGPGGSGALGLGASPSLGSNNVGTGTSVGAGMGGTGPLGLLPGSTVTTGSETTPSAGTGSQQQGGGCCPSARNNHSTSIVDNKLMVHGGHDGSKWLADMYILETAGAFVGSEASAVNYEKLKWQKANTSGICGALFFGKEVLHYVKCMINFFFRP